MAVLIEGISVVMRCDALGRAYPGGYAAFANDVPNGSLCADGELARVGFMAPNDVQAYVKYLEERNLKYLDNRRAVDLVVVDQRSGPCVACDWVEFGATEWNNDPACPIVVCSAKPTRTKHVVVPNGWDYQKSLSARHRFVAADDLPRSVQFVRTETGLDVYVDRSTGQEFYVGRSPKR